MTRVAVAQIDTGPGRPAPLEQCVAAVERGAAAGARLVVLPEYASGWAPRLDVDLAVPVDGEFVAGIRAAARANAVHVVVGVVLPAAERCANVALAIGADGSDLGSYTKVHLFDAFGTRESDTLVAGPAAAEPLVMDVEGIRFGVLTCYDLRFPEVARRLLDAGAQAVVAIAAWASGPGKADQLTLLARARALENTSYLVLASQHGRGRTGGSMVVDPLGAVVAQAGEEGSDLLVVDLDPDVVAEVRTRVPVLAHRRYRVVPVD